MDKELGSTIPSIHKVAEDILRGVDENDETGKLQKNRRRKKQQSESNDAPLSSAPRHVQKFDWKDMLHLADISGRKRGNSTTSHSGHATRANSMKGRPWIEAHLKMRECSYFVPTNRFAERCGCGREKSKHSPEVLNNSKIRSTHLTLPGIVEVSTDCENEPQITITPQRWSIKDDTELVPTSSYGSIVFEGTTHHVQYARVSFDTEPRDIVHLMTKVWKIRPPKLIITVHGGLTKFDLQPKLARSFRKGIMKIAKSTDAWIITSGLDEGVVKHVASALQDHGSQTANNHVVAIGIAPWGMLKHRGRFNGKDNTVTYAPNIYNNSRLKELNDRHSYFLFSDNGTVNRYGAEIIMRKRLETYLVQGDRRRGAIPLICVVLEGGAFTIKMVHDYVTTIPRIPVIVCDGSGRAADILAFAHQTVSPDGFLLENIRSQLTNIVRRVFGYDDKNAQKLIKQVSECTSNKLLMSIFRLGESQREDLDHAIMSCLLKGQNLSPREQLQLALAWNRADIARTEIFANGTEWETQDLHSAMMEALANDRIDFVQLLLENGVSMQNFLTFGRLEFLYNTDKGPQNTLRTNLLVNSKHHIKLTEIGKLIEELMGNLYKSNYTKEEFKNKYCLFCNRKIFKKSPNNGIGHVPTGGEGMSSMQLTLIKNAKTSLIHLFGNKKNTNDQDEDFSHMDDEDNDEFTFKYPYSELLIWAVLTKRQKLAKLMWRHGEEQMAKALVTCRLYLSMSETASLATGEIGMSQDFTEYSQEFSELAVEVLEYCTKHSRDMTFRLLTCELNNWGGETCLSLAANNGHRKFLAHPTCQMLLSDLWQGGLLMKSNQNAKVLGCLLTPPLIFLLGFKTREQLMLQPKTAAEHEQDEEELSDSDASSIENDCTDSSCSETDHDDDFENDQPLSISKLSRGKMNTSEKKILGPNRMVVAPGIASNRSRARTMSVKKRKNSSQNVASIQIDVSGDEGGESDQDEEEIQVRKRKKSIAKPSFVNVDNLTTRNEMKKYSPVYMHRTLSWKRKISEFYNAPITTYWLWFFAFIVFLLLLTYNLLVKTQRVASWSEWYSFAYILVWTMEICRRVVSMVLMDLTKPILKQLKVYFMSYRNGSLAFALATFLIAYIIRINPGTRTLGRILLICNSVMWSLKLVDYLTVQPTLGPYISMVAEMIPSMVPLCVLVFITLYSFGLLQQGIKYPNEDWHWILVRNIFLHPYFMLYGEVYADEIDTCGDEIWDTHEDENIPISMLNVTHETCVPGYWIAPVGLTVFMLAANVLLMNVMVASCTYIFEKHIMSTQEIFLFHRYQQVMEYESTPWLPPPFTVLFHIYWLLKLLRNSSNIFVKKNLFDTSLKLFLTNDEMERVHAFEEECVDDMKRETEKKHLTSNEERIHRTAERTDAILNRISNITTIEVSLKEEIRELEMRMKAIEARHKDEMSILSDMNRKLAKILRKNGDADSDDDDDHSVPLIGSPISARKTPGQYMKREKRKMSIEDSSRGIPTIQIDGGESDIDSSERISFTVPRIRQHTEGELSEEDLIRQEVSRPQVLSLPRGHRRHNLYTTIADSIETGDEFFDASSPLPMTPTHQEDVEYYGESDSQLARDESDIE
ncbi:unnamed protein product [Caenorhabditis bovis]|uniref:TRPM SLOG domain-containing protein n=1 Tax=Caenorhabditis bovis TaxID=2654633 RepID=A0A8S1FBB9_9PELO|nr:unnamed protein product [Caenorhabditis bovis]